MKNQIIFTALTLGAIILGTNTVQAQVVAQSATTDASITLADVISINTGSNTIGGSVDFNYENVEDYRKDQTKKMPGSLNITSTQIFNVNVKGSTEGFTNITSGSVIPLEVLQIIPKKGSANGIGGDLTTKSLSDKDQTIVANAPIGSELILDIDYTIPAEMAKSSKILGKPSGKYNATVTYTATVD